MVVITRPLVPLSRTFAEHLPRATYQEHVGSRQTESLPLGRGCSGQGEGKDTSETSENPRGRQRGAVPWEDATRARRGSGQRGLPEEVTSPEGGEGVEEVGTWWTTRAQLGAFLEQPGVGDGAQGETGHAHLGGLWLPAEDNRLRGEV